MNKTLLNVLKFLLFLGLGFGILYYVYQNQQEAYAAECALRDIPAEDCSLVRKVLNDFAGANFGWLAIVLGCFIISNISRAIRWNMLLRQLGTTPKFSNAFLTICLGYFANLGFPRIGEVVRAGTMSRYEKIPLEKVIGTVVVDRTIDVISILIMTALALYFGYETIWAWVEENSALGDKLAGVQWILAALALFGLAVLYLGWRYRERLEKNPIIGKVFGIIRGFGEGLQTVGRLDQPGLFALHSVNIWVMYFLMTYLCFFSFAPTSELGPVAGLVTFVAGGWGIVVPSPGGMGSYHFMTQSALTLYDVPGDDAFSWSNIAFFTIVLGCNVIIGLLALFLLPRINANYHPNTAEQSTKSDFHAS